MSNPVHPAVSEHMRAMQGRSAKVVSERKLAHLRAIAKLPRKRATKAVVDAGA